MTGHGASGRRLVGRRHPSCEWMGKIGRGKDIFAPYAGEGAKVASFSGNGSLRTGRKVPSSRRNCENDGRETEGRRRPNPQRTASGYLSKLAGKEFVRGEPKKATYGGLTRFVLQEGERRKRELPPWRAGKGKRRRKRSASAQEIYA